MAFAGNDLTVKLLTIPSFAPHAGLKALALLGILPDGEPSPESRAPPVTVPTHTAEEERAVWGPEDLPHTGLSMCYSVRHSVLLHRNLRPKRGAT